MYVHGIRALFRFQGYVVSRISMSGDLVQVNLRRDKRFRLACPACAGRMGHSRSKLQSARDLPLGTALTVLLVYEAVQGRCSACGSYATLHPPGIDPHARATRRLQQLVSGLARHMALRRIPEILPVSQPTAFRWDKAILQEQLPEPNVDDLRVLLIDEKAVRRHHGYVTLVINAANGELLHMAEGKKKESLESFFDKLSDEQKKGIVAVAIDRNGAYHEVVKEQLPDADIVLDKFHLIANYNAVIDEVRRSEWRKARKQDKEVIKGQRYNLFRRPCNRTPEQTRSLMDLLHVNENLAKVYILKDALRKMWTYRYRRAAAKYFDRWIRWALVSGVAALRRFARSLNHAKEEVLNFCRHPITLGPMEAFNNVVARIIHRACGHNDLDYLFLKLRQESLHPVLPK